MSIRWDAEAVDLLRYMYQHMGLPDRAIAWVMETTECAARHLRVRNGIYRSNRPKRSFCNRGHVLSVTGTWRSGRDRVCQICAEERRQKYLTSHGTVSHN